MIEVRQVSSLEKVRRVSDIQGEDITGDKLLLGENYSYQAAVSTDSHVYISVSVESPISEFVQVYVVKNAVMDFPVYEFAEKCAEEYITLNEGLMPDILEPVETQNNRIHIRQGTCALWVEVKIPKDFNAGKYPVSLRLCGKTEDTGEEFNVITTMNFEVLPKVLPDRAMIYTQWMHVDCIADVYDVKMYSEEHWLLIEKYIKTAVELGINMILTPVLTPPLDTAVGGERPKTQLVNIEKKETIYNFDFSRLKRWIDICRNCGVEYFEISHLFTQWGAKFAPNVYVKENGEEKQLFGWHTPSNSDDYISFLKVFLPELTAFLKNEGVSEYCYFHLSDEPSLEQLESYRTAHDIVTPLLEGFKTLDAISKLEFYKNGLIPIPVCATNEIVPFIENGTEHLWAYYCCGQWDGVGNRFLSMPSYRNRILGIQLYKYGIEGFLHWGYNFYYSQFSEYKINPYITTSSDRAFPSGDPFSVYPGECGPVKSLRSVVFYEALQDIQICRLLEKKIGKAKVIKMIEDSAEMSITFSDYPRSSKYITDVINKMKEAL